MEHFDRIEQHIKQFRSELDELSQLLNDIAGSTERRRALAGKNLELDDARKDFAVRLWALVSELAHLKGEVTEQLLLSRRSEKVSRTFSRDTA